MQTADRVDAHALTWRGLLVRAALAHALAYAVVAAILTDAEAALVSVGSLVGIALLRVRRGTLGVLELGGLLAFAAYWMVPAAINNLLHGEGLFETAVASILAVIGLTGAVAAAVCFAELARGSTAGAGPVGMAAVAQLVVLVGLAVVPFRRGATQEPADLSIRSKDVRFSATALQAEAGKITVALANEDLFWHTFTIRELDVDLKVPVKAERRVEFTAARGTYEFVCAIPGHAQAGMKGTLTVL